MVVIGWLVVSSPARGQSGRPITVTDEKDEQQTCHKFHLDLDRYFDFLKELFFK